MFPGKRLPRRRPHVIAIEYELPAQNQQPDPERKPQGPARNVRAQHRPGDGPEDAAGNERNQ